MITSEEAGSRREWKSGKKPYISLEGTSYLAAANPILMGVRHINISRIWLKSVKCNDQIPDSIEAVRSLIENSTEVSWVIDVTDPRDFKEHYSWLTVPELEPGVHCIVASSTPDFDSESVISFVSINVCSFIYVDCSTQDGFGLPGFVTDLITGKPVEGCHYRLTRTTGYGSGRRENPVCTGVTGPDGQIGNNSLIQTSDYGQYSLELTKNDEKSVIIFYGGSRGDRPQPLIARIFTDRYTYRPGDTLYFNCIVYRTDGYSSGHTVSDVDMHILLRDANWRIADTMTLTTDRFGAVSGSFVIPEDLLTGRFTLQAENVDEGLYSCRPINVEEFSQSASAAEQEGMSENPVTDDIVLANSRQRKQYVQIDGSITFMSVPEFSLAICNSEGNRIAGTVSFKIERLLPPSRPLLDLGLNGLYSENVMRECAATEKLRELFPLYDFDNIQKEDWQIADVIFQDRVSVEDRSDCRVTLKDMPASGTYRVSAFVDGVPESAGTVIVTCVNANDSRMPDNSLLMAVPLKREYEAGDTAVILVGSAFTEARVYYVVEDRFGFISSGIICPGGRVTPLYIPVTKEMKGGFSVRFGTAYQKICANSSVHIDVPFTDKVLDVSLTAFRDFPDAEKAENWELSIRDSEGKPVDASVTLVMYDSALDVYGHNEWWLVPWSDSIPDSPDLLNAGRIRSLSYNPELKCMAFAADSCTGFPVAVSSAGNIGSRAVSKSLCSSRIDMSPTAFFIPNIHTGRQGNVRFQFTVPRLLTRWKFQCLAHTEDLKSGQFGSIVQFSQTDRGLCRILSGRDAGKQVP